MIRFECDYTEGAHERILKRLAETNFEQTPGYGLDPHCDTARVHIRRECNAPGADVHFLVGGTQTNTVMISSILRPYQGAVSAASGHIATHETGAIEATGHKVLTVASLDGKITPEQIRSICDAHEADREHAVQPGLVYLSHPTEYGTLYARRELEAISALCRDRSLPLIIDGARMGYGLVAPGSDLSLSDIAGLVDMFSIGATKVGALFGEAVVITNDALKKDFRYSIKQRGGMLAKGRLLGIQFETLFEDGLYYDVSRHAIAQAMRIRDAFAGRGIAFRHESPTNQQFPILHREAVRKLGEKYTFQHWEIIDAEHVATRFCTSWATRPEHVDLLVKDIASL